MCLCVFAQACKHLQGPESGIASPRVGVPDVVMADVSGIKVVSSGRAIKTLSQ